MLPKAGETLCRWKRLLSIDKRKGFLDINLVVEPISYSRVVIIFDSCDF